MYKSAIIVDTSNKSIKEVAAFIEKDIFT